MHFQSVCEDTGREATNSYAGKSTVIDDCKEELRKQNHLPLETIAESKHPEDGARMNKFQKLLCAGDPSLVYVVIRPSETSLFEGNDLTEFPFPAQESPAETTSQQSPSYVRGALKEFLEVCMLPDDLPPTLLTAKDFLDATHSNAKLMVQFLQWLGERKENKERTFVGDPRTDVETDGHHRQRPGSTRRESARIRARNTSAQRSIPTDKRKNTSTDSVSRLKGLKRRKIQLAKDCEMGAD